MFNFLKRIFKKKKKKVSIEMEKLALVEREKANIRALNMRECKRKA